MLGDVDNRDDSELVASLSTTPVFTTYTHTVPLAEGEDFSDSGILTEAQPQPDDDDNDYTLPDDRDACTIQRLLHDDDDDEALSDEEDDEDAGATDDDGLSSAQNEDIAWFADKYFNCQQTTPARYHNALSRTISLVKRRPAWETASTKPLLHYTKASTTNSALIRYLLPENVATACSIFKNICKYIRDEAKQENETLREILSHGIHCEELRDEIYCQLVRQTNVNPHVDVCARAWGIICLCSVSFRPSATLLNPLLQYLRWSRDQSNEQEIARFANYCLWHLNLPMTACRQRPPCELEITAVLSLQPLTIPVQLLDGSVRTVAADPAETVKDVLTTIRQTLNLQHCHGWALYECTLSHDRHIKPSEYLADIFSDWESCYHNSLADSGPETPNSDHSRDSQNYPKLVFCKHIFPAVVDDVNPVELQLLYSQAVHSVVQVDEYHVPIATALHLAGLQAQIQLGEYEEDAVDRYNEKEFLCDRVLSSTTTQEWKVQIAAAHKRFGRNRTVAAIKQRYVATVSQLPLYGCTKVIAHYCGVWQHAHQVSLAFGPTGIYILCAQEQTVICECFYAELEQVILEESNDSCFITFALRSCAHDNRQRAYMFECIEPHVVAAAIEYHAPRLAQWTHSAAGWQHRQIPLVDDWIRLHEDLMSCRRALVKAGLTQRTDDTHVGIFRMAMHRLSWHGRRRDRQTDRTNVNSGWWVFSRLPLTSSLLPFKSHELRDVSARLFNSALVYAGVESTGTLQFGDLMIVVQMLMSKCLENTDLCNEFYLQLIKQTTGPHTDVSVKVPLAYWHLMAIVTCVTLPTNRLIFRYLLLHLKRHALHALGETSKVAKYCIQNICKSYHNDRRHFPPSHKEIATIINRCDFNAQVHLANGHMVLVQFDSFTTAGKLVDVLKAKAGMRLDARGYGLFQLHKTTECYLSPEEKMVDFIYMWEKGSQENISKEIKLTFRKRVLVEPYVNADDPVEIELVYHHGVSQLYEQKIHLTKPSVVELCALRAQTEYGDYRHGSHVDYTSVMRIVPCHVRQLMQPSEIVVMHKLCTGMSPLAANVAGLCILQQWPLFGATVFDVSASDIENLPECFWLAVSQRGVHLMERKGQTIYYTYLYSEIQDCIPNEGRLTIILNSSSANLIFHTIEAFHIVQLITDYGKELRYSGSKGDEPKQAQHTNRITEDHLLQNCSANGIAHNSKRQTSEDDDELRTSVKSLAQN